MSEENNCRMYDYDKEKKYPKFNDEELDKFRNKFVGDIYWNARNLQDIIDNAYDMSTALRLPNRKEEVIFSLVALACELYLKSLICNSTFEAIKKGGHNLHDLYKFLPDDIKSTLVELMNEPDFENKLKKIVLYFEILDIHMK